MASIPTLENIDKELAIFVPLLAAFQERHFAANKTYCQFLKTHDAPPGAAAKGKQSVRQPKSAKAAWGDIGIDTTKSRRWSAKIGVSSGTRKSPPSWKLTIELKVAGVTYRRVIRKGDDWAKQDWETV